MYQRVEDGSLVRIYPQKVLWIDVKQLLRPRILLVAQLQGQIKQDLCMRESFKNAIPNQRPTCGLSKNDQNASFWVVRVIVWQRSS